MTVMGLREARAEFSAVLKRVAKGERIVVTKHGLPMAYMIPPAKGTSKLAKTPRPAASKKAGKKAAKKAARRGRGRKR